MFDYTESLGSKTLLRLCYDSKILTTSRHYPVAGVYQKCISDSDKERLRKVIVDNNFFSSETSCEKEDVAKAKHTLEVTMGDKKRQSGLTILTKLQEYPI